MPRPAVPRYFLYGEPEHAVEERFLHIESIESRSAAQDWTIRPHSHAALDHLLVILDGGGEMLVEGGRMPFGRAVLVMPAGIVHGFRFDPGTDGHVITIADPLLRRIASRHAAVGRLREAARVLDLPDADDVLRAGLDMLTAEAAGAAPLTALAGEALLQLLLVQACRLLPAVTDGAPPPRRAATLVSRYRDQIDRHLRDGWSVADHARALGSSVARLRACCVETAGASPIRLLHARLLAEARRQLAYTDRTVAEIGYDLGFDDAAYFSRFFRRGVGVAPAGWRRSAADQPAAASRT